MLTGKEFGALLDARNQARADLAWARSQGLPAIDCIRLQRRLGELQDQVARELNLDKEYVRKYGRAYVGRTENAD